MYFLFDINTVFFTVFEYPMSYLEFFGTLFNLACVWLVARKKTLNWPVGLVGVVLFAALYWQIQLYADLLEQAYFFVTGLWGWYVWSTRGPSKTGGTLLVERLTNRVRAMWALVVVVGTVLLTYVTIHLPLYFPTLFPAPASFAALDSFTTVLSFVATVFMVRKQFECWYLWILVDVIGIGLYWVKGVHLVSLLYVVFLVMAIHGLLVWLRTWRASNMHTL